MNILMQHKDILGSALTSYIEQSHEYSIRHGIISSSEFDDIEYGFSPECAEQVLDRLDENDLSIDDRYINDILEILLTYKEIINDWLISGDIPEEEVIHCKADRKAINSTIRHIKSYAVQNNISLDF